MISLIDRKKIRKLARKVDEIGRKPVMARRRVMWQRHNSLDQVRPMILVFPEGSWRELLPQSALECETEFTREIEWELRRRIYKHKYINDDKPIERKWIVNKVIHNSGWGIEVKHKESSQETGAWGFEPVIKQPNDLEKLKIPKISYDAERTNRQLEMAEELLGDILDVELKGVAHISFHLMSIYSQLRGLEQVMWDMYDHPDMLHQAMAFLEAGHRKMVQQYQELNLLSLNNDETYQSSGGVGYTNELPKSDYDPEQIRTGDMWSSAEAQEMAQVSPAMHAEFILPYEKRLLEPFGLSGYGCCEDLTNKLKDVKTIPNLRRISISPWANVKRCAEQLEDKYIFSWKPHPAYLAGDYNPDSIRKYIKHALEVTQDCVLEIILKDTHTCENKPERFTTWLNITRELVDNLSY